MAGEGRAALQLFQSPVRSSVELHSHPVFCSSSTTGSETIVAQLTEARKNDSIKSVVLRVDSLQGLLLLPTKYGEAVSAKEEGKPVITSMGSRCEWWLLRCFKLIKIFAEGTTVTGSLVTFRKIFTSELMSKLHVTYTT